MHKASETHFGEKKKTFNLKKKQKQNVFLNFSEQLLQGVGVNPKCII